MIINHDMAPDAKNKRLASENCGEKTRKQLCKLERLEVEITIRGVKAEERILEMWMTASIEMKNFAQKREADWDKVKKDLTEAMKEETRKQERKEWMKEIIEKIRQEMTKQKIMVH